MKELKFYLLTDPHYFAAELGCSGELYDDFMHYEQKCFAETQSINESVVNYLKSADEADIILIAGDLSFNGEKESHKQFTELLHSLREAGKKIYVVTADHDFKWKREDTFAFGKQGRYSPEHTERCELEHLYHDFGFGDAIAFDKEHLCYVAQLGEGVRLLALNCDFKEKGKYHFSDDQLEWIKQQTKKAREDNQMMFAMCHYPILPIQPIFSIISATMIRDAYKVASLLADEGVHLIFTGHMHNQSINEYITEKGNKFYDVTTGSIIADPAVIRHVTIKDSTTVEIKSIPTPDFDYDTKGKDCKQYLKDTFDQMIVNILTDMRDDPKRVMKKLHIKDDDKTAFLLRIVGKILCKIKVGTLARLLFIKCDKSIRSLPLLDFVKDLVRGVFEGNQTYKQGTARGDLFLGFLKRVRFILKKVNAKTADGKKADLYELLKNTAGNYDIDDYNAVLTLK